jgi:hypothetical protein
MPPILSRLKVVSAICFVIIILKFLGQQVLDKIIRKDDSDFKGKIIKTRKLYNVSHASTLNITD